MGTRHLPHQLKDLSVAGDRNLYKMLRSAITKMSPIARTSLLETSRVPCVSATRSMSKVNTETDAEFDARYEAYFSRPSIDGWEVRKAMNDLAGTDLIPEPKIIIAALKACRQVNDIALAIRFIESVQNKCGSNKDIFPYLMQEVGPTMKELGIPTLQELGYDKPELALQSVYDM